MTRDDLVRAICSECGGTSEAWAEAALRSTLDAIAPALDEPAKRWLAEQIPPDYRDALSIVLADPDASHASIVAHVAHAVGLHGVHAREQIQCVMRAIGMQLEPEARRHLSEQLPSDARDLCPEPRPFVPPHVEHAPRPRAQHHLSDARPGSAHPLSEAGPRAHEQSIAASPDPHSDTKLSSAHAPVHDAEQPTVKH